MATRLDDLLDRLQQVAREGDGWVALCPCHDDHHPSLKVSRGREREIVAVCRACHATWPQIRQALGLPDGPTPYIAPAQDDQEEARRAVIWEARYQPWNRDGIRLAYAAADLHRALLDRIDALHAAACDFGPEDPASWDMLARANAMEIERRFLDQGLNGLA